jgi:ketosteroid isomerase-like protein
MSQENVQLIRGLYEAFARGNTHAVIEAMDRNIVWNEAENFIYAEGNPYQGPQAILNGVFMRLATEWDGFSVTANELLDAGDRVIALGFYSGICKATSKAVRAQMAHDWTIRDDKVIRFQQYTDTRQWADAVSK